MVSIPAEVAEFLGRVAGDLAGLYAALEQVREENRRIKGGIAGVTDRAGAAGARQRGEVLMTERFAVHLPVVVTDLDAARRMGLMVARSMSFLSLVDPGETTVS